MTMAEGDAWRRPATPSLSATRISSSWSLRPWLAMKTYGIPFAEEHVGLQQKEHQASDPAPFARGKGAGAEVRRRSGLGQPRHRRVPRQRQPDDLLAGGPGGARGRHAASPRRCMRALPRSATTCRWTCSRASPPPIGEALAWTSGALIAIWKDARARFGSCRPYFLGAFTNADAMYAPVTTRFRTYGVDLAAFGDDGTASAYAGAIPEMPAMAAWTKAPRRSLEAGRRKPVVNQSLPGIWLRARDG